MSRFEKELEIAGLGIALVRALDRKGMTQKELSQRLNISPQAVSQWVRGQTYPSEEHYNDLLTIFNML